MKMPAARRILCLLFLCVPMLVGGAVNADDTFPITLEAKYEESVISPKRTDRLITVAGKTRFPDGTNFAIGLRQFGEGQFVAWYDCVVRDKSFTCSIGPFAKPVAYGKYVVEARYAPDRQAPGFGKTVQEAERKDSSITRAKLPDGGVIGACIVQVGTPEQVKADQDELTKFFTEVHDQLKAIYDPIADHLEKSGGKTGGDSEWQSRVIDLQKAIKTVDDKVVNNHRSRTSMCFPRAQFLATDAIVQLMGILEGGERDFVKLPSKGNMLLVLKKAADELAGILENLKPSTEPEEDLPGRFKK